MPIAIIKEDHKPTCVMSQWYIGSDAKFVDVLAWLYLRKHTHALKVMSSLEPGKAGFPGRIFDNAIELLRYSTDDIATDLASKDKKIAADAKKKLDARISQRDGLLFQHVSWIAAALQFPNARAAPPHVRKADKGFDGLLIEVNAEKLTRLVLCEDKASIDPRPLVTAKIWPEIKSIIAGDRDIEILDAVTALLDAMHDIDREDVLLATSWERSCQFRVSLTAGEDQLKDGGYSHLFAGFDGQVTGAIERRMAEVMPMADVRSYLEELANRVIAKLQAMRPAGV